MSVGTSTRATSPETAPTCDEFPALRIGASRNLGIRAGGVRLLQPTIHFGVWDGPGTMNRSVPIPWCSGLSVSPYISSTYSAARTPKTFEVEVGVARHERIVRPVDHDAAELLYSLPLELLESASEARFRASDARRACRPVNDATVFHPREAVDEAEKLSRVIERAGRDTANALRDLEKARWNNIGELVAPRLALERDAGAELIEGA